MSVRPTQGPSAPPTAIGAVTAVYLFLALMSASASPESRLPPPIWLPAGLGVAAAATMGARKAAPGIWLGAFASSIMLLAEGGLQPAALGVGALGAVGAVAQAAAASLLQQRYAAFWPRPNGRSRALAPLLLPAAAAAVATIGASATTVSLAWAGLPPATDAWQLWSSAWLSNALALLLAAPPLTWLAGRIATWPTTSRAVLVALDVGLMLSIGVFAILWRLESSHAEREFARDASTVAQALETSTRQYQHDVEVLHALFVASGGKVTPAAFSHFVRQHMQQVVSTPGLQALAWAPVVPLAERPAFEAAMRRAGEADFQIFEQDGDGNRAPAGDRDAYVVIAYNEPHEVRGGAVGLNMLGDPRLREALERARDSGTASATPPIKPSTSASTGFVIVWPLYEGGMVPTTVAARRAGLRGYVLGAFRTDDLIAAALHSPGFDDVDVYLVDDGLPEDEQIFAVRPGPSRAAPLVIEKGARPADLQIGLHYTAAIDVVGRTWRVITRPAPAFTAEHRTLVPWTAILAGLAISTWAVRALAQRQQAAETLRRSEERFRALIEKSANAITLVDAAGAITYNSPNIHRILGYGPESQIGFDVFRNMHPDDAPRMQQLLNEVLQHPGASQSGVCRIRHQDGTWRWIESTATNLLDEPAVGMIVSNLRDISDARLAEEALRASEERLRTLLQEVRQLNSKLEQRVAERTADLSRLNAELNRALRARDEFLATMSHELRTPLNGILAFAELLLDQQGDPLSEHQTRSLQHITSSGQHLLALINDILDLSKIEAGHMELCLEAHGVSEICEISLLFVRELAAKKDIEITYSCSDPTAVMEMDPRRLKQMLVNLLGNAVKFTPAGGQVRLEVLADAERGLVSFTVMDSGIGIRAEDMERLFEPFTQLDSGLSRQHEGSGLGLALVKRLADLHGGSIAVASEGLGRGSRFTAALPWRRHARPALPPLPGGLPAAEPAAEGPPAAAGAGPTILLAEDSEVTIDALTSYLRGHNYQVVVARDGREALERAEELRPRLILMDIQMPVMDGLEAMRQLRATAACADTPIIALTALAMPGDRERCLAAGATAYLSKPVSLRELAALIARLLNG